MKFFTALFVTLVAIHASTQSPVQDKDIGQIVVEILNKVLPETKIILDHANTWADQLDSNKDHNEKIIVDGLTKVATKITGIIATLIGKLKEDASDSGKVIIDCIQTEKPQVDTLIGAALKQIADCEFKNYEDLSALITTVLKQLLELQANFETLTLNLSECGSGDSFCLTIFLGGIVEQFEDNIIPNAKVDLGQLKDLISGVVDSTMQCHIKEVIQKDITDVIDNLTTCFYNR
ncbi:unnamed protein product [Ceutorhynchus assimilis]|uniref:Uncharacterized protein n=1 Tax=Ceutorhynchus assimilis TaxID=467358 RepID=A0A9N9QJF9_9CUCU|nr:unnamed protein product [Ceutorhynchus assimilis]